MPAMVAAALLNRSTSPTSSERHQLDFWLGDWDTFEPEGALGASQARAYDDSVLTRCVVHELYAL